MSKSSIEILGEHGRIILADPNHVIITFENATVLRLEIGPNSAKAYHYNRFGDQQNAFATVSADKKSTVISA